MISLCPGDIIVFHDFNSTSKQITYLVVDMQPTNNSNKLLYDIGIIGLQKYERCTLHLNQEFDVWTRVNERNNT